MVLLEGCLSLSIGGQEMLDHWLAVDAEMDMAFRCTLYQAIQVSRPINLPSGDILIQTWIRYDEVIDICAQLARKYDHPLPRMENRPDHREMIICSLGRGSLQDQPSPGLMGAGRKAQRFRTLAEQAAMIDARLKLLDYLSIYQAGEPVGIFADDNSSLRQSWWDTLDSKTQTEGADGASCVYQRRYTLTPSQIDALLQNETGNADDASLNDGRRALGERNAVTIEGYSVVPPFLRTWNGDSNVVGASAGERILLTVATGQAPDGLSDTQRRRQLAHQAAWVEAKRLLWIDIEHMKDNGGRTVRSRLTDDPGLGQAIEHAVIAPQPAIYDERDQATVTMAISLDTLEAILGTPLK